MAGEILHRLDAVEADARAVETAGRWYAELFGVDVGVARDSVAADLRLLTNDKKLAPGSVLIAVAELRFLYKVTLKKDWQFDEIIPVPKKPQNPPGGTEPLRGRPVSRQRREPQASRDPDHVLRRRPAHLRSRALDPAPPLIARG